MGKDENANSAAALVRRLPGMQKTRDGITQLTEQGEGAIALLRLLPEARARKVERWIREEVQRRGHRTNLPDGQTRRPDGWRHGDRPKARRRMRPTLRQRKEGVS